MYTLGYIIGFVGVTGIVVGIIYGFASTVDKKTKDIKDYFKK